MSTSTIRTSDAQFSMEEIDRIRRVATDVLTPLCPRCGMVLTWSSVREPTEPSRTVTLLRCSECRRFTILSGDESVVE